MSSVENNNIFLSRRSSWQIKTYKKNDNSFLKKNTLQISNPIFPPSIQVSSSVIPPSLSPLNISPVAAISFVPNPTAVSSLNLKMAQFETIHQLKLQNLTEKADC
jgi:hypothetical protein